MKRNNAGDWWCGHCDSLNPTTEGKCRTCGKTETFEEEEVVTETLNILVEESDSFYDSYIGFMESLYDVITEMRASLTAKKATMNDMSKNLEKLETLVQKEGFPETWTKEVTAYGKKATLEAQHEWEKEMARCNTFFKQLKETANSYGGTTYTRDSGLDMSCPVCKHDFVSGRMHVSTCGHVLCTTCFNAYPSTCVKCKQATTYKRLYL